MAAGATIVNAISPDSAAPPRPNAYTSTAVQVAHSAKLNVANARTTRRIAGLRSAARSSFTRDRGGRPAGRARSGAGGDDAAAQGDRRSRAGAPRRPDPGASRGQPRGDGPARAPR